MGVEFAKNLVGFFEKGSHHSDGVFFDEYDLRIIKAFNFFTSDYFFLNERSCRAWVCFPYHFIFGKFPVNLRRFEFAYVHVDIVENKLFAYWRYFVANIVNVVQYRFLRYSAA